MQTEKSLDRFWVAFWLRWNIHWSASTLKPLIGEVNNIDHLATVQHFTGKTWTKYSPSRQRHSMMVVASHSGTTSPATELKLLRNCQRNVTKIWPPNSPDPNMIQLSHDFPEQSELEQIGLKGCLVPQDTPRRPVPMNESKSYTLWVHSWNLFVPPHLRDVWSDLDLGYFRDWLQLQLFDTFLGTYLSSFCGVAVTLQPLLMYLYISNCVWMGGLYPHECQVPAERDD